MAGLKETLRLGDPGVWIIIREKYRLTRRETEIIELVCAGRSNQQIADHLHIRRGTVDGYVYRIEGKLRVPNRVRLVIEVLDTIFRHV